MQTPVYEGAGVKLAVVGTYIWCNQWWLECTGKVEVAIVLLLEGRRGGYGGE